MAYGRLKICSAFYPVLLFVICTSLFFPLVFPVIDTFPFIKLHFFILTLSLSCLSLLSPGEKAWSRRMVMGSKGDGSGREALDNETSQRHPVLRPFFSPPNANQPANSIRLPISIPYPSFPPFYPPGIAFGKACMVTNTCYKSPLVIFAGVFQPGIL